MPLIGGIRPLPGNDAGVLRWLVAGCSVYAKVGQVSQSTRFNKWHMCHCWRWLHGTKPGTDGYAVATRQQSEKGLLSLS